MQIVVSKVRSITFDSDIYFSRLKVFRIDFFAFDVMHEIFECIGRSPYSKLESIIMCY